MGVTWKAHWRLVWAMTDPTVDTNSLSKSLLAKRKVTFRQFLVTYHANSGGPETFVVERTGKRGGCYVEGALEVDVGHDGAHTHVFAVQEHHHTVDSNPHSKSQLTQRK